MAGVLFYSRGMLVLSTARATPTRWETGPMPTSEEQEAAEQAQQAVEDTLEDMNGIVVDPDTGAPQ